MKSGIAGSLYLIVIGLILAGVGGLFTWLLGGSYSQARGMDQWVESDCIILQSEVLERQLGPAVPVDYHFGLLYGYEFKGVPYTSESHDVRGNAHVKKEAKIAELVARFPAGSQQRCLVNPDEPSQAVLKKDSKAPGYSIWFPLLFVVGGLGIVARSLVSLFQKPKAEIAAA